MRISPQRWAIGLVVGAIVLAALTFAPWGHGTEGWRPTISGTGKVSIDGASHDEVAFLQDHTGRPGLLLVALALIILLAGVVAWWRTDFRIVGAAVAGLGGICAAIWSIVVLSSLPSHLFDDAVTEALSASAPQLDPGWGVIGSLVVALLVVGAAGMTVWTTRAAESS